MGYGGAGSPCCLRCHTALILQNTCWQPRCPDFWGLGGFRCHALKCPQGVVHLAVDILRAMSPCPPVVAVLLVLIVKGQTLLLLAYPFSACYRLLLIWAGSPALRVPAPVSLPDSPTAFSHLPFPVLGTQKLLLASGHPWF